MRHVFHEPLNSNDVPPLAFKGVSILKKSINHLFPVLYEILLSSSDCISCMLQSMTTIPRNQEIILNVVDVL